MFRLFFVYLIMKHTDLTTKVVVDINTTQSECFDTSHNFQFKGEFQNMYNRIFNFRCLIRHKLNSKFI